MSILGITQVTPTSFEADLDAFDDSLEFYNSARSSRQAASDLLKTTMADVSAYLSATRKVLTISFGDRGNTMWAQAGFVQPSTAIPRRAQDWLALTLVLVKFFTKHPSYEVASKNVTAARGTAARTAAINAQNALQPENVAVRTANHALATAQSALVKSIRYVIKILSGALAANDPRWEAFGLNIPATKTTPPAPTDLTASIMGSSILLACDPNALTERYRWRTMIVGVENKPQLAASTVAPMAELKNAAPGVTLSITVQGVNGGAQGKASDPLTVTMPVEAIAKPAAAKTEQLAPSPAGNGSANGNGSRVAARLS
ncbi:MAG: hypothetical protein ABI233_04110 [Chthoniobacterales bacterium]